MQLAPAWFEASVDMQRPPKHVPLQILPHAPQLLGSRLVSAQTPAQLASPASQPPPSGADESSSPAGPSGPAWYDVIVESLTEASAISRWPESPFVASLLGSPSLGARHDARATKHHGATRSPAGIGLHPVRNADDWNAPTGDSLAVETPLR